MAIALPFRVALLGVALAASAPEYAHAQKVIDWDDADAVKVDTARQPPAFPVVAVVPKPFLKRGRLELQLGGGLSVNDPLIRHWQSVGQLSYFLSETLAVGVEAGLYRAEPLAAVDLVPLQARRLPTLNRYSGSVAINFHYAPIYGKFAHARNTIVYWEAYITSGVGAIRTQSIPRDPALAAFTNDRLAMNLGLGIRLFANRFTTLNLGVRDYVFVDKLEPRERSVARFASAESARANADSALINNVVVQLGIAVWFPTTFKRRRHTKR